MHHVHIAEPVGFVWNRVPLSALFDHPAPRNTCPVPSPMAANRLRAAYRCAVRDVSDRPCQHGAEAIILQRYDETATLGASAGHVGGECAVATRRTALSSG